MAKLDLNLKISKQRVDYSELYLSESYVVKNNDLSYEDIVAKQIQRGLDNNVHESIDKQWPLLQKFINDNDFSVYNILSLNVYNTSFDNFKKHNGVKEDGSKLNFKNIALILCSNNEKLKNKTNTICFYLTFHHDENAYESIGAELTRIEFFQWNISHDDFLDKEKYTIELASLETKNDFFDDNKWIELFHNTEKVFDGDKKGEDPLKIRKWLDFLNTLNKKYSSKNDVDNDNCVIALDSTWYLCSKQNKDITKGKYELFNLKTGKNPLESSEEKININWSSSKGDLTNVLNDLTNSYETYIREKEDEISEFINEINKREGKLKQELELKSKLEDMVSRIDNDIKIKEYQKQKFEEEIKELKKDKDINFKDQEEQLRNYVKELTELKEKNEKATEDFQNRKINIENIKNELDELRRRISTNNKEIESQSLKIEKIIELKEFLDNSHYNIFQIIKGETNEDSFKKLSLPNVADYLTGKIVLNELLAFSLISSDQGTARVVQRFRNALNNVNSGYYKNPYFYYGIRKPKETIKIIQSNNLDKEIINKYKLNKKQENAVIKAINTNSVFYLQGPPGTGKTQTISAITDWIIKNNMNVVMTSNTHEAIDNFFDRLHDNNKTNPNLVAFKYRFNTSDSKKQDSKYCANNLFNIYMERMINNICNLNDNNYDDEINSLITKFNEYKNKYEEEIPLQYKDFIPLPLVEIFFSRDCEEAFKNQFLQDEHDGGKQYIEPIGYEEEKTIGIVRKSEVRINSNNHTKDFNELLKEIIDLAIKTNHNIYSINYKGNYLTELIKLFKVNANKKEGILQDLLETIKNKDEFSSNFDSYNNSFQDYLVKNRLLNVIGVTTTSRNDVEILGKNINLYSDYPVDYMIIDEISKCAMPEIFSKAILAKKVIFAGDYLQLPPQPNINSDDVKNYLIENISDLEFYDEKRSDKNEEMKNYMEKYINQLYSDSFFSILVKEIKESSKYKDEEKPYEYLTESHRFGKEIMRIVNKIYPKDEQLISPRDYNFNQEKYKMFDCDKAVVMVNLIKTTQTFNDQHDFELEIGDRGFDQKGETFKWNKKPIKKYASSLFNQYSAYVITKLLIELFANNKNKLNSFEHRIGIITLTRTQKEVVKNYISKEEQLNEFKKYIKVDTIDNFQGREEEVIIVDFIRGEKKVEDCKIRNTPRRTLDFLEKKERINVAVSRARQKLILVGNFEYLRTQEIHLFEQYYDELSDDDGAYMVWGGKYEK